LGQQALEQLCSLFHKPELPITEAMKQKLVRSKLCLVITFLASFTAPTAQERELRPSDMYGYQTSQTSQRDGFSLPLSWKGIIPLETTRQEVEAILGDAIWVGVAKRTYKDSSTRITVWYSTGPCDPVVGRWKVAAGVVVAVDVVFTTPMLLDDLRFDRTKYTRNQWTHPAHWASYYRDDEGIQITTSEVSPKAEFIESIRYGPKTNDDSFKCEAKKP
jgi:hypothetical protein